MSGSLTNTADHADLTTWLEYILQNIGYWSTKLVDHGTGPLLTILLAVTPIYAAAHTSLQRPQSASEHRKSTGNDSEDDASEAKKLEEETQFLDFGDVLMLPLLIGGMTVFLYGLIDYVDPDTISKGINVYFSFFGIMFTAKMLTDAILVAQGFVFPDAYRRSGKTWILRQIKQQFECSEESLTTTSPLPGRFSRLPLPKRFERILWLFRGFQHEGTVLKWSYAAIFYAEETFSTINMATFALASMILVYVSNVAKPWYLSNLTALSFAYSSLQLMSPTSSENATLMLCLLFFYDIYMVFFTPIMVTVATMLDIPAKIFIPSRTGMTIMGLGDIVVPGMTIAWALRFDLWRHYVKKWKLKDDHEKDCTAHERAEGMALAFSDPAKIQRATYRPAHGHWGTRYWTHTKGKEAPLRVQGTDFSKTYFYATLVGYILGLIATLVASHTSNLPQPALLYLVPGVLGALYLTAAFRGEMRIMRSYSEDRPWRSWAKDREEKDKQQKEKEQRIARRHAKKLGWLLRCLPNIVVVSLDYLVQPSPPATEDQTKRGDAAEQTGKAEKNGRKNHNGDEQTDQDSSDGGVLLDEEGNSVPSSTTTTTSSNSDKHISNTSKKTGQKAKNGKVGDNENITDVSKAGEKNKSAEKDERPDWVKEHVFFLSVKRKEPDVKDLVVTEEGLVEREEDENQGDGKREGEGNKEEREVEVEVDVWGMD